MRENNGVIELYASQDVQLAGSSVIQANGGAEGISAGGNIVIKSGGTFSDSVGQPNHGNRWAQWRQRRQH